MLPLVPVFCSNCSPFLKALLPKCNSSWYFRSPFDTTSSRKPSLIPPLPGCHVSPLGFHSSQLLSTEHSPSFLNTCDLHQPESPSEPGAIWFCTDDPWFSLALFLLAPAPGGGCGLNVRDYKSPSPFHSFHDCRSSSVHCRQVEPWSWMD